MQVATPATEEAKENAEREGLSQQGLDQGLHSTGEKLERVVQAAGEVAEEEADSQGMSAPKK